MKRRPVILTILWLTAHLAQAQSTLHFIIAADTQHPDTSFAASCRADSASMHKESGDMAQGAGYKLQRHMVCGPNFTPESLLAKAQSVPAKPGDVVFFYISCHGGCKKDDPASLRDERRWLMFLSKNKKGERWLSTDTLLSVIEAKKARLNVMVVDACGKVRNIPAFGRTRGDAERRAYRALLSACGTVRAFSSKCTEFSYCDKKGGLYTNALLDALDHFISIGDGNLTWKTLLDYAAATTTQRAKQIFLQQHPASFFDENFKDKCGQ